MAPSAGGGRLDEVEGLPVEASLEAARAAGDDVREVEIEETPVRVYSVVVDRSDGQWVVQVIGERISEQRLLLIGAGEMIELAANHFVAKHPKSVTVANRTLERGQSLADRLGAEAILLNELAERLPQFDMIVTCTASTLPILGKGLLERVIKARRHAPVFIVDLAVPRDVEPEAGALDDVFLYSVDDLSAIVKDNLQIRKEAVVQAEAMIVEQTGHFLRWLEGRTVVPTIHALSGHVDEMREIELERARRMLANGAPPDRVIDALARGLANKFLHAPLSALNTAGDAERAELIALFQRVYRLHEPPVDGH